MIFARRLVNDLLYVLEVGGFPLRRISFAENFRNGGPSTSSTCPVGALHTLNGTRRVRDLRYLAEEIRLPAAAPTPPKSEQCLEQQKLTALCLLHSADQDEPLYPTTAPAKTSHSTTENSA